MLLFNRDAWEELPEDLQAIITLVTREHHFWWEQHQQMNREANKRAAIHAGSTGYAARMAASGFDLVTVWVDAVAIAASLAAADEVWAQQAHPRSSSSSP